MSILSTLRGPLLCLAILAPLPASNPPVDTAGALTVRINGPAAITQTGTPVPVQVVLENAGAELLRGRLRLTVIDGWSVAPAAVEFEVAAKSSRAYDFYVTAAPGSYSALYPIHAYAEFGSLTAHPVLIVKTGFADAPHAARAIPWKPIELAADSGFALWRTPVRREVLQVFGSPPRTLPVGWEGSDPETRANAQFGASVNRGKARECIAMHEPWYHGAGTILTEFPLVMPRSDPLKLRFSNAVRDDTPGQAAGDGVTFRVRVLPLDAAEGQQGEIVFERHLKAAIWQPAEVDLSRFAGQRVRLQLESNPGPRNNTTNDQSYWAEPTLLAGKAPEPSGDLSGKYTVLGRIGQAGEAYQVLVSPRSRGLLDSMIEFNSGNRRLAFHGFSVRVAADALDDWRSPSVLTAVTNEQVNGRLRWRHSFRNWFGTFDLVGELWLDGKALHVHWKLENAPAPQPWFAVYLESAGAGPWNDTAQRVYAGDGNVLQDPAAFSLGFDGHRLSTSYAGFDFVNGISMLEAVDAPPNLLEVDPKTRTYSLRAAHEQTMTFIPSRNVWDAVKVWRDINGLQPAGGVSKLAGRFVFDLWGGNFAPSATALTRAFHYGLTDAMVVWHNWQRWGYDYRLPEIFPPNPALGSTEDFAALAELCKKNGVLFAPHDNYIDFYPDAKGFSYDQIAFSAGGAPVKAWLNQGRDAQSYRWRADRVLAAVESNLLRIRARIAPTAYFIDVWSSAGPYDYWTRDGAFHDRLSTRKVWADAFNWIRRTLGDDAPQISESGHDQLIGALDGAQTNHLRVDTPPEGEMGWTVWNIKVADAERIPWFDAAHHDRFILHGAGYENRYAGGLDTAMHGIYSDDYITTEVLDGHPPMVPSPMGREVVRKYWLLHDVMRSLALARFDSLEFAGGNLHRQHVKWRNGAEVWVNRGPGDWTVEAHTLPQYGFYARVPAPEGTTEAAIERRDGVIVEWSHSARAAYSNARPYVTDRLPLTVVAGGVDDLGGRQFRLTLNWNVTGPIPDGYRILVHFTDAAGKILFQGDHNGPGPSGRWRGEFRTSVVVRVPETVTAGQRFELRAGLFSNSGRAQLTGLNDDQRRLRLAAMEWTGGAVSWRPMAAQSDPLLSRFNKDSRPISFDRLTTAGAVRVTEEAQGTLLIPLPGGGPFEIRLRLPTPARTVEALSESREVLSRLPVRLENGVIVIERDPAIFAYRIVE
ncbi:exported hypothetical protein [Candidatus Sulfopaludibacter sp. SbA3]|nr:exported hypothetical protein [Candidatus Sulfopaludibacter sp. SbA3]